MLSGRLADTAGAVPHGYVCPGVGDVVHGDAGSVVLDRGSTSKPLFSTKQSTRSDSTKIPGKLVAGRLDSTPSPNTHILLPSGITLLGVENWVTKLADVA